MVGWNKIVAVVVDPYPTIKLYVVGDRDRAVALPEFDGKPIKTPHEKKVDLMYNLFAKHTNADIISVRFPTGSTAADWTAYWKHELNKHPEDALIIIYFHGLAGGRTEYNFNMPGFPHNKANAHELIKIANCSKTDCTFLLDCHIKTRFPRPWSNDKNNVELIARGQVLQDHRGNVLPDKGDFTESLVRNLENFATGIGSHFESVKKPRSIPEVLAKDKSMYSNPVRPAWFDRTRYKDKKVVCRVKISPTLTRMTRQNGPAKLVFVRERIQAPGLVKWPLPVRVQIQEAEERGEKRATVYNMDNMPKDRAIQIELVDEGFSENDGEDAEWSGGSEHDNNASNGEGNGVGDGNDTLSLFIPQ
ncbi:hypothetical protein LTR27_003356 [Elasticomyces elasticus]|nr:hypothetical protein LTR27_003356 [Elasticomyces elasticus]